MSFIVNVSQDKYFKTYLLIDEGFQGYIYHTAAFKKFGIAV